MTGIDGNYKTTCESVMDVLRSHKDSLMAVLEAFVYDPLLNWRLMDSKYFVYDPHINCSQKLYIQQFANLRLMGSKTLYIC